MYKTFFALLTMFWIFDICDMPFMAMFDVEYPINTLVWLLIWVLIPSTKTVIKKDRQDKEQ